MTRPRGSLLRDHGVFVGLLVCAAALRTLVVAAYHPIFMLQRDTYAYLRVAIELDAGPQAWRPAMYPVAFLRPLLAVDGLLLVAIAQHVIVLALAVGLYACLRRFQLHPVVAGLATAPVLLDGYQLSIEHYLLSEAFFQALVVAAFVSLAWRAPPTLPALVAGGLLLGIAAATRYVGTALIVPAVLYAAAARAGWARAAALAAAWALPVALYALWSGAATGSSRLTAANGFFLYGRVASFAECSEIDPPPDLRRFCFEEPPARRGPNRGVFALAGVDVEELRSLPDANARVLRFSRMAIVAQPLDYGRAVGADLLRFFSPAPPPSQEPYVRRWRFPLTLADADPHPYVLRRGGSAPAGTGLESFAIERGLASKLRALQGVLYVPGPLLALMLVGGLAGCVAGARRPHLRRLWASCLLFTLGAVLLLLAPVMTTVYHFRYGIAALPLAGPACALGATICTRRVRPLTDSWTRRTSDRDRGAR